MSHHRSAGRPAVTTALSPADEGSSPGPRRSRKGFAGMTAAARRAAQSKGGKASQALPTARRWTSATAAEAGRKGGLARHANAQRAREGADGGSAPSAPPRPPGGR